MANKKNQNWLPLWVDPWLFGSTRIELTPAERAIWIDFLAIASKNDGYVRASEGIPYPTKQLAGFLMVDEDLLKQAIEKFIKYNKVKQLEDGTLRIVNWDKYQISERYKRSVQKQAEHTSEKAEHTSEKAEPRVYKSIIEYNKTTTENNKKAEDDFDPVGLKILLDTCNWCEKALHKGIHPHVIDYVYWKISKTHKQIENPVAYTKAVSRDFNEQEAKEQGWKPFEFVKQKLRKEKAKEWNNEYLKLERKCWEQFKKHPQELFDELSDDDKKHYLEIAKEEFKLYGFKLRRDNIKKHASFLLIKDMLLQDKKHAVIKTLGGQNGKEKH